VTFSERASRTIAERAGRAQRVQSWFLDMSLVMAYWGGGEQRAYHHTAPVNMIYALHEALLILEEEGLENAWARHRRNHLALAAGLEALGLRFVVDAKYRLPQLNCVTLPEGIDDAAVRGQLLRDFGLEIGAGLGPLAGKVWRIGLMGYSSSQRNVLFSLGALEAVLRQGGARVETGQAVAAAQEVYAG
jgi:alanine-glyoxylate transaminase/serine-glyoxylate transaminase/serine-pyruvate transaminase